MLYSFIGTLHPSSAAFSLRGTKSLKNTDMNSSSDLVNTMAGVNLTSFHLNIMGYARRRLQDYKFILKISTCVINAQSMQLLSRIFQDISRAIESRYLIVT